MFIVWLFVALAGGALQVAGGVLTIRHVRERWMSAGDGRPFRAYLLERPNGWISAKVRQSRVWLRRRLRLGPAVEPVTLQPHDGHHELSSSVVNVTPGSPTVEAWPNVEDDLGGFAAVVREKLLESDSKIEELRRQFAARDQEIEARADAEVQTIKRSVRVLADRVDTSRRDGLRSEFSAAALVLLGVALATLGGAGLVFWT